MRRIVQFGCEESSLVGTVDEASGGVGILIVSGGNEVRSGAHRGMAMLAQRLADAGTPVFRFDRRGVGDSEGENAGWSTSAPDIAAALAAFRREQPQIERVIGFGNCDAATALLLLPHGCDAMILANPWLGDEHAPPPPAALRRHYWRRVRSPAAWRALLGGTLLRRLNGLSSVFLKTREEPLTLAVSAALRSRPATILLATGDRTAQVFAGNVRPPAQVAVAQLDTASHSFAGADVQLADAVIAAVRGLRDFRATEHPIAPGIVCSP